MAEKQLYAAVQLQVQSVLILEREGLQAVSRYTNYNLFHALPF
jgi:hypothetical protein